MSRILLSINLNFGCSSYTYIYIWQYSTRIVFKSFHLAIQSSNSFIRLVVNPWSQTMATWETHTTRNMGWKRIWEKLYIYLGTFLNMFCYENGYNFYGCKLHHDHIEISKIETINLINHVHHILLFCKQRFCQTYTYAYMFHLWNMYQHLGYTNWDSGIRWRCIGAWSLSPSDWAPVWPVWCDK